ncbi:nuclear pore complex subunit [Putridiphycobacter roseus]|uniref:Nuclear pore complex subunit n=1 Tax=Putridiphycobacter roseus TaxID=2219161 RepID=A0A2W1MWH6_9FLAO|nr:DUF1987 domain-containing protein [Putridiphycobacter roseus]PZE16217.1 nuclear pore complex subunit [Putridiphycobacter roseus]
MMTQLNIPATEKTPSIRFDPANDFFEIKGVSLPVEAEQFYSPIIEWVKNYIVDAQKKTKLMVDLQYFNISSSKQLLDIFFQLKRLIGLEKQVLIEWLYDSEEEDLLEMGQDYEFMVGIPFKYTEHQLITK